MAHRPCSPQSSMEPQPVEKYNSNPGKHSTARYAVNKFSDESPAEFSRRLGADSSKLRDFGAALPR